jgi:hypothetical protein
MGDRLPWRTCIRIQRLLGTRTVTSERTQGEDFRAKSICEVNDGLHFH